MQSRYQIHIHYNGTQYVAAVPELDGCTGTGTGQSYSEALASAEKAIVAWVFEAINEGKRPPEPVKDFTLQPPNSPIVKSTAAPITHRLHHKLGKLTNRQLAEKLGLSNVGRSAFAGAAVGQGVRAVRIALALALKERPSRLWPHLPSTTRSRDDFNFYQAGGLLPFTAGDIATRGEPMDCDERQALYESLVEEYRDMFARMDDAARATWFAVMDESVMHTFDVVKGESPLQTEERYAVKLYAIVAALRGLPCAEQEQRTIEDLCTMAGAIYKRHEVQSQAASKPTKATDTAVDPYEQAVKELRAEGKL